MQEILKCWTKTLSRKNGKKISSTYSSAPFNDILKEMRRSRPECKK